ncbi:MAG: arsenate reductase (glutaredoxin) [Acidobacteriota bacterium]|nr:arsenate reductase (glutaredoxin) [Acidobacteriota bacterium]
MSLQDTLLHNPRCSKSRGALDLVGDAVPVRRYLDEPLSLGELRELVQMLGVRPIEITRTGEERFKELGLSKESSDEEVLRAIAENPILLERPILVRNGRAVVGRPVERVKELL